MKKIKLHLITSIVEGETSKSFKDNRKNVVRSTTARPRGNYTIDNHMIT